MLKSANYVSVLTIITATESMTGDTALEWIYGMADMPRASATSSRPAASLATTDAY